MCGKTLNVAAVLALMIANTSVWAQPALNPWIDKLPPIPGELPQTPGAAPSSAEPVGPGDVMVTVVAELVCERRTEDSEDEVIFEVGGKRLYADAKRFDNRNSNMTKATGLEVWQGVVPVDAHNKPVALRVVEEDTNIWICGIELDPDDLIGEVSFTLVNDNGTVAPVLRAGEFAKSLPDDEFQLTGDTGSYKLTLRFKIEPIRSQAANARPTVESRKNR